ncbi:MAG: MBL fold metallo-hydrolase [Polyangiaceae bacterium]|nr:MBL fold metallo-hydrolase [Polyangiaceae bacterium]
MAASLSGVTVRSFIASRFALDGGAMHGIVPRPLWERVHTPDAAHRIALVARILIVESDRAGTRAILDVGLGERWSPKERERYAIADVAPLPELLREASIDPDSITHVVLTHLHWDHAGGVVDQGGDLVFPRAEHVVSEAALAHALQAGPKDGGSFRADVTGALRERAKLRTVARTNAEILPGVEARFSDGHTTGLLVPFIPARDDGPPLAFPTDLVPTRSHCRASWIAAYDNRPATSADEKQALFQDLAAVGGGLVLYHDPEVVAAWPRGAAGADVALGGLEGP